MRRPLLILAGLIVGCGLVMLLSFRLGAFVSARAIGATFDDLEWLRLEFHLDDREIANVRLLHEGYLPVCRSYCERIAAAKAEMLQALGPGTNVPPVVEQKLAEIGSLRAQCQAAMLRHFAEVSRTMPEPQGRRYLAEMQRLTLGAHEQIEKSMTLTMPASHEHHQH